MKYSNDLYQLVRSLSKSEKRYFRLFAARYSGQKKYMRLFEVLERQESYDEDAVKREFEADADAAANQFHVTKNYLYKLLLRSLRSYYAESSSTIRTRELITDVEILYERGLFKQARKLWRQAKKLADRIDDPELKLAVVRLRHQLSGKDSKKLESLDTLQNERRQTLSEIELLFEHDYVVEKLGNICTKYSSRGPAEYALLDEIMQSSSVSAGEPIGSSFRIRQSYLWAHATYHYGKNELEQALHYMRRLQQLYEEHSVIAELHPEHNIGVVNNILILLTRLEWTDEYIEELQRFEERFKNFSGGSFVNTRITSLYLHSFYWNSLALHANLGNFDHCLNLSEEIDLFFENYPNYTSNGTYPSLIFLLAYSHFAVGQYRKGLHYLNVLLNEPEPMKGRSGYYAARTLEIIIHYELGNTQMVLSRLRSFRNYLEGKNLLGEYEREMITFFHALLDSTSDEGRQTLFENLKEAFSDFDVRGSNYIFAHLDIGAWIESKVVGKSFAEAVRVCYRRRRALAKNMHKQELLCTVGTDSEM